MQLNIKRILTIVLTFFIVESFFSAESVNDILQAVKNRNVFLVKALLKKGADVNTKDIDNKTLLIIAVKNGNEKIIELLLDNNADMNLKDNKGKTALDYADKNNDAGIINLFDGKILENEVNDVINSNKEQNLTGTYSFADKTLEYNDDNITYKSMIMDILGYVDCSLFIKIGPDKYSGDIKKSRYKDSQKKEYEFNKNNSGILSGNISRKAGNPYLGDDFDYMDKVSFLFNNEKISGEILQDRKYRFQNFNLSNDDFKIKGKILFKKEKDKNLEYYKFEFQDRNLIGKIETKNGGSEYFIHSNFTKDDLFLFFILTRYRDINVPQQDD